MLLRSCASVPILTIILLLVAAVQLAQLFLSNAPGFVRLRGPAGACGLGRFGAVAARRGTFQEVLGYTSLQVFH